MTLWTGSMRSWPTGRTARTADSGVPLYVQRVAGHQAPAVTARYLHPDTAALAEAGSAFSAWWGLTLVGRIPAAGHAPDGPPSVETGA